MYFTIVEVLVAISLEGPLRDGDGGNTGTGARVAAKATVATTSRALERRSGDGEVAVGAGPETTRFPVVRDEEGH